MDLNHLQTLCTVIEAGSISKAARQLFVTQPAISVKIQEIEAFYQVKLLERTNKGVVPTEIGLFVYQESQRILEMLENMRREISRAIDPVKDVTVGASSTIGNFALPCTIFVFKERFPEYKVLLNICNSAQVMDKLAGRKVEIGLIEGPLTEPIKKKLSGEGIVSKRIARSELVLVAPHTEEYRELGPVTLEVFQQMPLILREPGSGIRAHIEQIMAERNLRLADLNVVLELNSINAIISAVASGKGVSLLPRMAIRKELRYRTLIVLDKAEDVVFHHDFTLLYKPAQLKKQAAKAFITLLKSRERGFC
jgi:DNA-binding transcriptional LysR family regulator